MLDTTPQNLQIIPTLDGTDIELKSAALALTVPEAATNYFTNPSVEVNTSNFGSKVAPTRDTTVAAYGRYSLKVTPLDVNYQTIMSLWLPDGNSDIRLSSAYGASGVINTSAVSFEITGKPGELVTASVEPVQAIDFFNRAGPLAASVDGTGLNTWAVSGANLVLQNSRVEATGVVDASNARIGNNGTYITGNIESDVVGIFTSGVVGAWPVLMQMYNATGPKWLGIRLETSAIRILGYNAGVETSLASAVFSPVTGTVYNVRAEVTYNGTNYVANVYVNNTLLISSYTYNNADLITYGGNSMGIWLTVKGAPVGAVPYFDNFLFTIPQYAWASKQIKLTSDWQRVELIFYYNFLNLYNPFLTPFPTRHILVIRKNSATMNPFWTDAFSYENNLYPTTYFDGDFGGSWDGLQGLSSSTRTALQPGGAVKNLKDLSVIVTGLYGMGFSPVENQSTPSARTGGSTYQKTLFRKRVKSLICILSGSDQQDLARKREAFQNCFTPNALSGEGKNTKLLFQIVDPKTGTPRGPVLEALVKYSAGLEGAWTNDFQEKFALQLETFSTPGISEVYPKSLTLANPAGANTLNAETARINGQWNTISALSIVRTVLIDRRGAFWFGYPTGLVTQKNTSDTSYPALTVTGASTVVLAGFMTADGTMYLAGSFTAPGNYIIKCSPGGAWAQAFGALWNNTINALALLQGNIMVVGGDFTAGPGGSYLGHCQIGPPTVLAVPNTLNNPVNALCALADGSGYFFGGSFTLVNAVTYNRIGFCTKAGAPSALGTGVNNTVRALAIGANGKLYLGGDFTTAGGAAIPNIAAWNGTSYEAVGSGLNGAVYGLWYNSNDGMLYAVGKFTATGDGRVLTPGFAKFNGSIWLPCDIVYSPGTTINLSSIAGNKSSILLGAISYGATPSVYYSFLSSLTYAGNAGTNFKIFLDNSLGTAAIQIYQLNNYATGKTLYFDLNIAIGEVVTIDITSAGISVNSSYGPRQAAILAGSDVASFGLQPGVNKLFFTTGPRTATFVAYIYYKNAHWSFDGGVY